MLPPPADKSNLAKANKCLEYIGEIGQNQLRTNAFSLLENRWRDFLAAEASRAEKGK